MMFTHRQTISFVAFLGYITQFQLHLATASPSANITTTTSHGSGCPKGAGAVIGPTSSDNSQILTFYSDAFNLFAPNPGNSILDRSKSCNGTVSLVYPDNVAFKLEAVTYSVMSRLEREVNAYFFSVYTLSPGTGAGIGVSTTTSAAAEISHKWQFNGTGRAQRTFRYYSLAEMTKSSTGSDSAGEVPVLSSLCGTAGQSNGGNNTVEVGIDTRVAVQSRIAQATGRIDSGPDFELEMVQLHLRWEACK